MSYGTKIFDPFWKNGPHYLSFLGLGEIKDESGNPVVDKALNVLYGILESSSREEIDTAVRSLLKEPDWRPHLVALITLLALKPSNECTAPEILWRRLIEGSWVSPQIAAVLKMIDSGFEDHAHRILSGEIPLMNNRRDDKLINSLSALLSHSHEQASFAGERSDLASTWFNRVNGLIVQRRLKREVY